MLRFALAVLVVAVLASAAEASADVARLRVHLDSLPAPQIYVAAYNPQLPEDSGGGAYSCAPPAFSWRGGPCSTPWNPHTGIVDTHWEGAGTADVAFVDDAPSRGRYFAFALAYDGSSVGGQPNPYAASGTATVTDLDGTTRTISFARQPGQDIQTLGQTPDPTAPPPPAPPTPLPGTGQSITSENCTVGAPAAGEQTSEHFIPFLEAAIDRVGRRGIKKLRSRPMLDNVLTCPQGRVVVRVSTRRSGRTITLAKVDRTFKYCCVGRSTHRLELTKAGRRVLAKHRRLRIRVAVRLFDHKGRSVQRSRRMTVGKALDRR
jgi:hypothetical protein